MERLDTFTGQIYATEETKRLILIEDKFQTLRNERYWVILKVNEETCIPQADLRVTAIDANHSPGSVMFLFQTSKVAVLYTGDTRAEPWHINVLTRNPSLYDYIQPFGKTLDAIYADTTFGYRGDSLTHKYLDIPDNHRSINKLFKLLEKYPKNTIFFSYIDTTGYENFIAQLCIFFDKLCGNGLIHLGKKYERIYKTLKDINAFAKIICRYMTNDVHKAKIHICQKRDNCPCYDASHVFIRSRITISEKDVDCINNYEANQMIEAQLAKNQRLFFAADKSCEGDIVTTKGRAFLKSKEGNEYLPRTVHYNFSRHSSYKEIFFLVMAFKPKSVYPIWSNPGCFEKGFSMRRLFNNACSPGGDFQYDLEMLKKMDIPSYEYDEILSKEPISTAKVPFKTFICNEDSYYSCCESTGQIISSKEDDTQFEEQNDFLKVNISKTDLRSSIVGIEALDDDDNNRHDNNECDKGELFHIKLENENSSMLKNKEFNSTLKREGSFGLMIDLPDKKRTLSTKNFMPTDNKM
ncbi:MAG: hypothetical protein L0I85_06635, partial [Staphylococcus equorum]|nr:hypothetical protein [Staphylococcus equorum]